MHPSAPLLPASWAYDTHTSVVGQCGREASGVVGSFMISIVSDIEKVRDDQSTKETMESDGGTGATALV